MAYIDSLLGHGEQILYVARQHIFVLVANILTELSLIALLVAAGVASNMAFDTASANIGGITASNLILLICVAISVIVLISGFMDYMRWTSEQYVVTDRRVMQVRGILNKRVIDSSLEKINDVELRQSLLGRMMNFGTVEILTAAGDEGVNVMDRIESPLEFKRAMLDAKHNHERGYGYLPDPGYAAPRAQAPSPPDIVEELTRLAALRDRGILSPDEFEAEKRELLRRGR
ncbi:MAG: PH domain-containing protein [Chloroflexales bacterium]|nr:PH domain-containing protein [Chloroflexales bacterium]